jgi:hypothetical protein
MCLRNCFVQTCVIKQVQRALGSDWEVYLTQYQYLYPLLDCVLDSTAVAGVRVTTSDAEVCVSPKEFILVLLKCCAAAMVLMRCVCAAQSVLLTAQYHYV